MPGNVFDSSAIIALIKNEPGADRILHELPGGVISSVNAAEVLTVLMRNAISLEEAKVAFVATKLQVVDFTFEQAAAVAVLLSTPEFRAGGISLGDSACMATALQQNVPVVTTDRKWSGLNVPGLRIISVR